MVKKRALIIGGAPRASVLVGIPNDDYSPHFAEHLAALEGAGEVLTLHYPPPSVKYETEGTARKELLRQFLASGHAHLLQLDSDVLVEPDTLKRLLARDAPAVCALFRWWKDPSNVLCWPKVQQGTGLHRIVLGCHGAMLMTRATAAALAAAKFAYIDRHGNDVHFWRFLEKLAIPAYVDSDVALVMEPRA